MPSRIANPELFSGLTEIDINFEKFFLIGKPQKIMSDFTMKLTELTYLPKVADPRADWVASVAVPAFLAHRAHNTVRKFATIGTGGGLDAIAALEIFNLEKLAITDIHPAVVSAAVHNIRTAANANKTLSRVIRDLIAVPGDICAPLVNQSGQFDLIYENLPNLPLDTTHSFNAGQTSSIYVPARAEEIPAVATDNLIALHWLALMQSKNILSPTGAVISLMGGCVPISCLTEMAKSAGYHATVLTYTWKIQSEPEEIVGSYKKNQEAGLGPFYFYPASVLELAFKGISPAAAGANATAIEQQLAPHRLDAVSAYQAHKNGATLAHTVVVVRSTVSRCS